MHAVAKGRIKIETDETRMVEPCAECVNIVEEKRASMKYVQSFIRIALRSEINRNAHVSVSPLVNQTNKVGQ